MKTTYMALMITLLAGFLFGCLQAGGRDAAMEQTMPMGAEHVASAVFAGGCLWCTEADFEKVNGVVQVVSGYTAGSVPNPTYEQVSAGGIGHVEAVKVTYDPTRVSYEDLLEVFWRHVNPADAEGQFVDRGPQYRSVIFYGNDGERLLAETSKEHLAASGRFDKPIVTEILPLGPFYPSEEYHQNDYSKNPIRYRYYRYASGRDPFLNRVWGKKESGVHPAGVETMKPEMKGQRKEGISRGMMGEKPSEKTYTVPDKAKLRGKLTPLQYEVTQENGTEPAFSNAYWDNHEAGIYSDIVSGEPLFSSTDKFDSGTGWPSFTRPLEPGNIVERTDRGFFMTRTEVRSKHTDSHLGHVFDDGPPPTGLRYCINSAALRFIPAVDLEKEGYGKYAVLFH